MQKGGENVPIVVPAFAQEGYLRTFMGHQSLNETAYYIHLLPENLVKSPGVDWETLNAVLPEVCE